MSLNAMTHWLCQDQRSVSSVAYPLLQNCKHMKYMRFYRQRTIIPAILPPIYPRHRGEHFGPSETLHAIHSWDTLLNGGGFDLYGESRIQAAESVSHSSISVTSAVSSVRDDEVLTILLPFQGHGLAQHREVVHHPPPPLAGIHAPRSSPAPWPGATLPCIRGNFLGLTPFPSLAILSWSSNRRDPLSGRLPNMTTKNTVGGKRSDRTIKRHPAC